MSYGYLHTTTVFPARFPRSTGQESLPEIQVADDRFGGAAGRGNRRRRVRPLAFDQAAFLICAHLRQSVAKPRARLT